MGIFGYYLPYLTSGLNKLRPTSGMLVIRPIHFLACSYSLRSSFFILLLLFNMKSLTIPHEIRP